VATAALVGILPKTATIGLAAPLLLVALRLIQGVANPADPSRINPAFDGGDHLHFNLACYLAMGNAVPLELLLDPACT
jgi:hypothetical protein